MTDNGGGTGTCTIEYSHNGGAYTSTLTPFAAIVGTNTIAIRKSCTGTGCDNSAATTYTWTGVPDPSNPSLNTKSPNVASVCEGKAYRLPSTPVQAEAAAPTNTNTEKIAGLGLELYSRKPHLHHHRRRERRNPSPKSQLHSGYRLQRTRLCDPRLIGGR